MDASIALIIWNHATAISISNLVNISDIDAALFVLLITYKNAVVLLIKGFREMP